MQMHIHGNGSRTALLLHGMASSSRSWDKLIQDLVANDYTVYAPDLPGHGLGLRDRTLYSLSKWSELVAELVPSVDLLVGHSMGGLLAIHLRRQVNAKKTVLVDPVLRFPRGKVTKFLAQFGFYGAMQVTRLSRNEIARLNIRSWDPHSVRMIESPRGLHMLDESVMVIRPRSSFVAPLGVFKKLATVNLVTLKGADHNLHVKMYEKFFSHLREFAFANPELKLAEIK